ncbi:hypothetical protein CR513_02191, partial [Mucuna pruriens]
MFRDRCPKLKRFTIHVVSLTSSSYGCDHTRRRNHLHKKKMNDLLYTNKKIVALPFNDIHFDDEWITEEGVNVDEENVELEQPQGEVIQLWMLLILTIWFLMPMLLMNNYEEELNDDGDDSGDLGNDTCYAIKYVRVSRACIDLFEVLDFPSLLGVGACRKKWNGIKGKRQENVLEKDDKSLTWKNFVVNDI